MERKPVVRLENSQQKPLTEREIVEASVDFLNGRRIEIPGWSGDNEIRFIIALEEIQSSNAGRTVGKPRNASQPSDEAVQAFRNSFREAQREMLSRLIADPGAVALELKEAAPLIDPKPLIRVVQDGLWLDHFYEFKSELDLVTLGLVLLADPRRRSNWPQLCRCQLPSCGAFFFEKRPPTGRPQRRYCSRTHMLRAHDQNAPRRMATRRPKKPK
jgi:hypothetical protein